MLIDLLLGRPKYALPSLHILKFQRSNNYLGYFIWRVLLYSYLRGTKLYIVTRYNYIVTSLAGLQVTAECRVCESHERKKLKKAPRSYTRAAAKTLARVVNKFCCFSLLYDLHGYQLGNGYHTNYIIYIHVSSIYHIILPSMV